MDLTFYKYEFEFKKVIKGCTISEINKKRVMKLLYTMGLSEPSLTTITKQFSFLPHCKSIM